MSLILWYKLDGDLTDSSGNNLHGSGDISYVNGKINKLGNFDGINIISVSTNNLLNLTAMGTLSVWVKPNRDYPSDSSSTSYRGIAGKVFGGGTGQQSYLIDWHGSNTNRFLRGMIGDESGSNSITISYDFQQKWTHVVFSWDGTHLKLYANGIKVGQIDQTRECQIISNDFTIGYPFGRWEGLIDDVRIYDHLLSEYEVKELLKLKILHYKFDDFQEPTENQYSMEQWGGHGSSWELTNYSFNGNLVYKNTVTNPDTGNNFGFRISGISKSIPSTTTNITISFWAKLIGDMGNMTGYIRVYYTDLTYSQHYWSYSPNIFLNFSTFQNIWTYVTATVTLTLGKTPDYMNYIYVYRDNAPLGAEMDISMIQVEFKDHATPFVDGSRSGKVMDCSGNKNHLELLLTTTPQWKEESLIGKGLYLFDGSMGSYIQDYINTNLGTGDFSVSFIVSHSLLTTSHVITLGSYLLSTDGYFTVWIRNTGDIVLWIKNNVTDTDDSITLLSFIDLDTKYLITVTKDSSNMKLYINGELEGTTLCDSNAFITNKLVLGQRPDFAQNAVDGYIDDVRIYSTLLSSDDIRMLYETRMGLNINGNLSAKMLYEPPVSKGLMGWWKLDSDANDYSGYNNNGTVYGATLSTGLNGGLYSFDGNDDYISIPHIDGIIDEFSILGWAYFIDGNPNTIIGNWQDGGTGDSWLLLGHTLQYINFFVRNSTNTSGYNIAESTTYPLNEWLFYVLVFNRGEMSIYRNCNRTLYKDYCGFTSVYQNSLDTWIGRYATQYTNGKLSDIRLYNRLLAENEINLLYKIGLGLI